MRIKLRTKNKNTISSMLKPSKAIYLFLMVFVVLLFGSNMKAQTTTLPFSTSGTWICPPGVTSINVEAWGGGAGGGVNNTGGGGGGAFAGNNAVPVSPGASYTITVGSGGTASVNSGGDSNIALTSTATVFLVKAEGGGKTQYTIGGSATNCIGSPGLVWSGGNGIIGTYYGGGGGGGSAGAGGAGGNGSDSVGETGGAGGIGGAASTGTAGAVGGRGGSKDPKYRDGEPGNTPGSGGGEKYYKEGNDAKSGLGANGQVIISYVIPTVTAAATAASVCPSGSIQNTTLAYSATTGSPITYSITWNNSPVNAFLPVANAALPASPITISVPANTNAGTYTGTITVKRANGNFSTGTTFTITVNPPPPTTTGVSICPGGSGSLTATATCSPVSQLPKTASGSGGTSELTTYPNTNILVNFPTLPTGALVTKTSTTISYLSNGISYRSELRAQITPPAAVGSKQTDLQASTLTSSGTVTNAPIGIWGTGNPSGSWLFEFRETFDDAAIPDANITNVTITVDYTLPGTLDWYTAASGGTKIGSGSPFNPVGEAGSGIADTNTPGTFTYYAACSGNNSCRTATNFVIDSVPTTPLIGAITQPDCTIATGSVVLNGLPATGTWNLYQNGNAAPIVTGGTGTTYSVSALAGGDYTFTVRKGTCTSVASASVKIIAPVTATWNVVAGIGTWTNGPPTIVKTLTFNGNYNSLTDTTDTIVEGCSCNVNSGATVVFTAGKTLKISNEVKVLGPSGFLTFENNASLVQINDVDSNSGNITYNRLTSTARSSDYSYWSSPVANQYLSIAFPNSPSGFFYSYDAFANPENWKKEAPTTTIMKIGTGYILQGYSTNMPPGLYNAPFNGVPNNGTQSISIGPAGTSNLIGNPYPSAIDADQFLTFNSGVIDGTLYFWTHNTALQLASLITNAGSGAYAYTSNDYASYNLTGGVGVDGVLYVKGGTIAPSGNTTIPTGKIAAGQAFFTTSIANGQNAIFNNSMRVSGGLLGINNSQFFKTTNTKAKTTTTIEKHRIWLNLSNDQGAFKQTLVGYITGGTNEFDSRFDGTSFDGNEFVDFYSVNEDMNLVIQGRALPFQDTDEVPLGYRTTIDGDFTINIDQADGLLTDQAVFIEDKLTNTIFDLKKGDYTFTTAAGTFNERFVLRYVNKSLGTNDFDTKENLVLVSNKNKQIRIHSPKETIDKVLVYDIAGKQIYQKTNVNGNELSIANLAASHQVLVVKTVLQNGQVVSNKVIY
jgi:hypothetical protein